MNSKRNKDESYEGWMIGGASWIDFTPDQIEEIRDAAIMYGWDRNAASRYLWTSTASVKNHAGDLLENQLYLSQNKINIINLLFPVLDYRIYKLAKAMNIWTEQIKECIEKWYVEIPKWVYLNSPSVEEQNAIIKSFDKHWKISYVLKELWIDKSSISKVLQANGIQITIPDKSKLERISIISAYRIYNKNSHRAWAALWIEPITIEKTRCRFYMGNTETAWLTDQEIYEKYKDKNVTEKDFEKVRKYKLRNKLKTDLSLIIKYKTQIEQHLNTKGRRPSVTKASKEIWIFDTTWVRKLSNYELFDTLTHSFNAETYKLSISEIFETYCKDQRLLWVYNELFSKYNGDINMKEYKIRKFLVHSDII